MNDPKNIAINSLDVIIPTYNGGARLIECVKKIEEQDFDGKLGVIIVDSGSTDGSIEKITENQNVKLIRITQQEFSHSHARNLGGESSDSDAILFMTQDAIPISNDWLLRMIEPLQEGFAAVSCTDNTDNSTDLYYKVGTWRYQRDLKILHVDRVCEFRKGMTKKEIRENSILNDVACCIRRDIFLRYKFEGDFAEDLQLGKRLILDGYKLKILGTLGVDHYHDRPQFYYLKRQYVETKTLDSIMELDGQQNQKEQSTENLHFTEGRESINDAQAAWILCQTIWALSRTFDSIELAGRILVGRSPKSTCLFLFVFRQLLKRAAQKNLMSCDNENISSLWDCEIRNAYERAIKRYEYLPMTKSPISDVRGFCIYALEPYIRENNLKLSLDEIKKCIFKEAARLIGESMTKTDLAESIFPEIMEKV